MSIMAVVVLGLVLIRIIYMLQNKKRVREITTWDEQPFTDDATSEERHGIRGGLPLVNGTFAA
ncbi:hypothetical protein FOCG_17823 [Fusarium oxysporum f. sp. radicis-lycopersici 26381]|nr:hypothetical protein FOCG_17823 [Fusarium oxysporum f. sp. radicis-lycopersici 26381]